MLKVLDLCSGVGGGSLGIVAADLHNQIEPTTFVEINPYCQKVLVKWFPSVPIHSDLFDFHAKPEQFDLVIAGFPCPPFSLAGKREGSDDKRNLWKEVYRVIQESEPIGFILENVPGIRYSNDGQFFKDLLWDIARIGYDAEWGCISVRGMGGIHLRKRFFLIAYPQSQRRSSKQFAIATQQGADSTPSTPHNPTSPHWTSAITTAHPSDDGLSDFLAGCLMTHKDLPLRDATINATTAEVKQALQAVGNSICPQVCGKVWKRLYERISFS